MFIEYPDHQDIVLGIATDVRSWKLCYELNQILGIQLRNAGDSGFFPDTGQEQEAREPELLFDQPPVSPEQFEDHDSFPHTEFILYSKETQKLPAETRPFRFFLLIRSESGQFSTPEELAARLIESTYIASVVNFSDNKNLQSLLP